MHGFLVYVVWVCAERVTYLCVVKSRSTWNRTVVDSELGHDIFRFAGGRNHEKLIPNTTRLWIK